MPHKRIIRATVDRSLDLEPLLQFSPDVTISWAFHTVATKNVIFSLLIPFHFIQSAAEAPRERQLWLLFTNTLVRQKQIKSQHVSESLNWPIKALSVPLPTVNVNRLTFLHPAEVDNSILKALRCRITGKSESTKKCLWGDEVEIDKTLAGVGVSSPMVQNRGALRAIKNSRMKCFSHTEEREGDGKFIKHAFPCNWPPNNKSSRPQYDATAFFLICANAMARHGNQTSEALARVSRN